MNLKVLLASAAVALAAVLPAKADQFTYTGFTVQPGGGIPFTVSDPAVIVNPINVAVGEVDLTGTGTFQGMTIHELLAWCLDITTFLQPPTQTYQIVPLGSGSVGNGNPSLTALQVTEIASLMAAVADGMDTNQVATQLAIWKLEYGPSLGLSTNSVIGNADLVFADTLVADASGSFFNPGAELFLLDAPPANQILGFAQVTATVPEPATLSLFGLGLIGLGVFARRRKV